MVQKLLGRFSHLDTIPACDIQQARQTRCDRNSRAMLRVTRAKINAGMPVLVI